MKNLFTRYSNTLYCILLISIILSSFLKVLGHDFILNWDDGIYVADNIDIRGITSHNIFRIITTSYAGNYAPLHLFSYMVENSLWGLDPGTLLLTNVALHCASTITFFQLLIRYGFTAAQAFVAAAIFAVHPVQVESVAWISQRKNTLSMLLFLLSWQTWLTWLEESSHKKRTAYYLTSLITFAMALLTKSVAVILPLIFATHLLAVGTTRNIRKKLLLLLPYIVLAAGCFTAAMISQTHEGGGRMPYLGGSFAITMMNMLPVFSRYLTLLIFPAGLSAIYNSAIRSVPDTTVILSGVVLVLFVTIWIRLWKSNRFAFFWLSLFIIGLLPVSNVIPIVAMMNDRYLYYPLLGIAPFAVYAINGIITSWGWQDSKLPVILSATIILSFAIASFQRVDVWKNPVTLWRDTLFKADSGVWYSANASYLSSKYAESLVLHAREFDSAGKSSEAFKTYLLALSYDDSNYEALLEVSRQHLMRRQPQLAQRYLLKLTETYKRSDDGLFLLSASYANSGDTEMALEILRKVLVLNPNHFKAAQALEKLEAYKSTVR